MAPAQNGEKTAGGFRPSGCLSVSYALSTNPDRRQEVHTCIVFAAPFTLTLTDFTLDFHILLDIL